MLQGIFMKTNKFTFLLGAVLASIVLSACSKYKIAYDYNPPKTKQGIACMSGCQKQLRQCNHQCNAQYKHCSVRARQQAQKALPVLKEAYPLKLEIWLDARARYEREYDRYEFRHFMAISRRDRYVDRCMRKGKKSRACHRTYRHDYYDPYLSLSRPYFNTPRPIKPTLASETQRIRKKTCSNNCKCNSNYRLCFTSCGGAVKSKKVCMKNCN